MGNTHPGFWHQFMDHAAKLRQVGHAVMDEEYLPIALNLVFNGFFDQRIIKHMQFGNNRLPVWRRGRYDGKIPSAH